MHLKQIGIVGACALAALGLSACGSKSAENSKKLNWMESSELTTMDPSKASDFTSMDQLNNTFVGLYRLGKNAKAEPALATKTTESSNGRNWTFTLRKNDRWSNGDPVTARDFVYSWRRTVNPDTGAQYSYLFSGVGNADQITEKKKSVNSLGIKAVGKYKLKVNLDRRIPYFKLLLAFPVFAPQNQHAVQKYGKNYGTASKYQVYNGPFIQKGWSGSNLSWHLVKNNSYWNKSGVKLNSINFTVQKTPSTDYSLYQSNKLDGAMLGAQGSKQLRGRKGYTRRALADTQFIALNQKKDPALRNLKVRQALSMAINRPAVAQTTSAANEPAYTMTPAHMTKVKGKDYVDTVRTKQTNAVMSYKPKQAARLFRQGLKEIGKSKLNLTMITFDTDSSRRSAEAIQSNLQENLPGLKVKVQAIPLKSALSRAANGNFDLLLNDWVADFSDPISFLNLCTRTNSNNYGKWNDSEYNRLIQESNTTSSDSQRWHDLASAERVLIEQQGVIPVFHNNQAWMVRPSVKGIVYNSAGAAYDFSKTTN